MAKKDERYLNVTLKTDSDENNDVIISFSGIFKMLKKYFLIWIVSAVVAAVLIFGGSAVAAPNQHKKLAALIGFTFPGIEQGLDPAGNTFDVTSIKNPTVIETALTQLNIPLENIETVRQNISFEKIIPSDAMDKITTYKSIFENAAGTSAALSAAEAMLDITYYPSQFKVYFNYGNTDFTDSEAVDIINTLLDCYREYFMSTYGYNEALGVAVKAVDYSSYDYAEAIDVFDSTLDTLRSYVNDLDANDSTRFRSSQTGYTFSDLANSISTIQSMDLDILSSYITVNNVTKDKDSLITYYQYRIDSLTRDKTIAQERLAAITESINTYEKDDIIIFGNGTDNTNTQYTQASEQYDTLIKQKIEAQTQVSTNTQRINYYTQRINALKGNAAGSSTKVEKVEQDLASLYEKINILIDDVDTTANEYYETVAFANAYSVLVPASATTATNFISRIINTAKVPFILIEALLVLVYFCFSFIKALILENKKKKAVTVNNEPDAGSENEEETK